MPSNYPTSLDDFANPAAGSTLANPPHHTQHGDLNDAVEAIEAELGLTPSGASATVRARVEAIETAVFGGTSFPSQPAYGNNRPYYRTDLAAIYRYDGAAWQGIDFAGQRLIASSTISPVIAANQNNWTPTGLATAYRIRVSSSAGALDITGLAAQEDGRHLWITNIGGPAITLKFNNAGSAAANRFLNELSADRVLTTHTSVELYYSSTDASWYICG